MSPVRLKPQFFGLTPSKLIPFDWTHWSFLGTKRLTALFELRCTNDRGQVHDTEFTTLDIW